MTVERYLYVFAFILYSVLWTSFFIFYKYIYSIIVLRNTSVLIIPLINTTFIGVFYIYVSYHCSCCVFIHLCIESRGLAIFWRWCYLFYNAPTIDKKNPYSYSYSFYGGIPTYNASSVCETLWYFPLNIILRMKWPYTLPIRSGTLPGLIHHYNDVIMCAMASQMPRDCLLNRLFRCMSK